MPEGKKSSLKSVALAAPQHKTKYLTKKQQKSSEGKERWWHEKMQSTMKTSEKQ